MQFSNKIVFIKIKISLYLMLYHQIEKFSICFILFWGVVQVSAQKDSIYIAAKLSPNRKILEVKEEIIYHNHSGKALDSIKLLNWIAAYNKRGTSLVYRKLEDRDNSLHFAKPELLGKTLDLKINSDQDQLISKNDLSEENLFFVLNKPLQVGESIKLELQYQLQLPDKKFTGYGTSESDIALKYFFIVPDHFDPDNNSARSYNDIEEAVNFNTHWKFKFDLPPNLFVDGNLQQNENNSFNGYSDTDPEFVISQNQFQTIKINSDDITAEVKLGYAINPQEVQNLEFFLPLQLKFIKEKTGYIPERLFISDKFRKKEDFFGNNDISFWKFRFKLFTDAEKVDMDYFGIITKKILDESIITSKEDHHWFKNGLKSYLEIQYLKKFYRDAKLLGNLPETSVLGIKPLKWFHASDVKLLDRYGLAYQYIMSQNLDQKIDEPFSALSNFNDMTISSFETGSLFSFSADKMGEEKFNDLLKNYIAENRDQEINPEEFSETTFRKRCFHRLFSRIFKTKKQS